MAVLDYKNVDAALTERGYPTLVKLSKSQAEVVIGKLETKVQEKGTE